MDFFSVENLHVAWERCSRETFRPDIAGDARQGLFRSGLHSNLRRLSARLNSGEYQPVRPLKYFEAKKGGMVRSKTILSVDDAVVYQCFSDGVARMCFSELKKYERHVFGSVLDPEAELPAADLLRSSEARFWFYQFWPAKRNEFVAKLNKIVDRPEILYKLETDVTGFYDSIVHSCLFSALTRRFELPEGVADIMSKSLNCWSGTKFGATHGVGIPQGPGASALLANVLLLDVDMNLVDWGLPYLRYMDDIKVYAENEGELSEVLVLLDQHLKSLGLHLNSSKTKIEPLDKGGVLGEKKKRLLISGIADDVGEIRGFDEGQCQGQEEVGSTAVVEVSVDEGDSDAVEWSQFVLDSEINALSELKSFWKGDGAENLGPIEYFQKVAKNKRHRFAEELDDDFPDEPDLQWVFLANYVRRRMTLCPRETVRDSALPLDLRWVRLFHGLCYEFTARADRFHWAMRCFDFDEDVLQLLESSIDDFRLYENVQYEMLTTIAESGSLSESRVEWYLEKARDCESDYLRVGYLRCAIVGAKNEVGPIDEVLDFCATEVRPLVFDRLIYYLEEAGSGDSLVRLLMARLSAKK